MELLQDLARYQAWADAEHWKVFHANPALLEDAAIRTRLIHMATACEMLTALARGEIPDVARMKQMRAAEHLEAEMRKAHDALAAELGSADLDKIIALPRGPKGPFEAPAGVVLLQALMHSQHHRGQNASRMRELGVAPPMTDFIIWHAQGRP